MRYDAHTSSDCTEVWVHLRRQHHHAGGKRIYASDYGLGHSVSGLVGRDNGVRAMALGATPGRSPSLA